MRNSSESCPETQNLENKKSKSCFFETVEAKIVPLGVIDGLKYTETQKSCLIQISFTKR